MSYSDPPRYALTYLAYGSDTLKYQTIISIYTYLHCRPAGQQDTRFIIYADQNSKLFEKHLQGLNVQLETISQQQAAQYLGPGGYILRLKPCIFQEYFAKYQQNLLYVDADTFFRRDATALLAQVAPGQSIMNEAEYDFVDGGVGEPDHWFTIRKLLRRNKFLVNGEEVHLPIATMMWNSGVIGLSLADAGLVKQVLALTDELYAKCRQFLMEQLATSFVLQTNTQISSTEDYIEHYWRKEIKASFNARIPGFLAGQATATGPELYARAYEFAQATSQITTPFQEPLASRIRLRMKLIWQVARRGHL